MKTSKVGKFESSIQLKPILFNLVEKARYKEAFIIAKKHSIKNTADPVAQYLYAMLLGDSQEGLTKRKIELNRKKSAKILRNVVKNIRSIPSSQRYSILNEYYWFTRQPKKQYQHGQAEIKKGSLKGYYSMGVGAVSYAKLLLENGKISRAQQWLLKAQKSWEAYFKTNPGYYNAYCWYAESLGMQNKISEMNLALKKASKLAKRPADYMEFNEVRKSVEKYLKITTKKKSKK